MSIAVSRTAGIHLGAAPAKVVSFSGVEGVACLSMKTQLLFDVPRTHPSARDKLNAFKYKYTIETWHTRGMRKEEHPWLACLMPRARKFGYGVTEASNLFDCIEKVGRLLDEAGVCVTGETERLAIQELCKNNNIPFDL